MLIFSRINMVEIIEVMLRDNFQNVSEDRLGQIDKGGVYYVNSKKKIFERVNPDFVAYTIMKGLHAHDNVGNKYSFFGNSDDDKVRRLYKDNVVLSLRIEQLTRN